MSVKILLLMTVILQASLLACSGKFSTTEVAHRQQPESLEEFSLNIDKVTAFDLTDVKAAWSVSGAESSLKFTLIVAKDPACSDIVVKITNIELNEQVLTLGQAGVYYFCIFTDRNRKTVAAKNNPYKVKIKADGESEEAVLSWVSSISNQTINEDVALNLSPLLRKTA